MNLRVFEEFRTVTGSFSKMGQACEQTWFLSLSLEEVLEINPWGQARWSTLEASKPTAFQWFLEASDDPQMHRQLGQTGHLVTADESCRWFQSVCTSATWRQWTICQSAPRGRLLWGLNLTVLSGCLFTWCRQHSVIIPAWLPARHAIPNQRQSNWSSSNTDKTLSGTEWTEGWIWWTLNLHKDCRD